MDSTWKHIPRSLRTRYLLPLLLGSVLPLAARGQETPASPADSGTPQEQKLSLKLPDSISAPRVACSAFPCRMVAQTLVGPAAIRGAADLVIGNTNREDTLVLHVRMMAVGDASGQLLTVDRGSVLLPPWTAMAEAIPIDTLPGLRADRYAGAIWVRTEGIEQMSSVPFILYVKDGIIPFLTVLLLGFLLGRLGLKIGNAGTMTGGGSDPNAGEKGTGGESGKAGGLRKYLVSGFRSVSGFQWHGDQGPNGWRQSLAFLSGVAWTEDDDKMPQFRARALGGIVVLGMATYQGLKVLYLNNPTFGDGGVLDYAAVLVWALAADGGQRYLANLKWP